jgi:hypothetical protein
LLFIKTTEDGRNFEIIVPELSQPGDSINVVIPHDLQGKNKTVKCDNYHIVETKRRQISKDV